MVARMVDEVLQDLAAAHYAFAAAADESEFHFLLERRSADSIAPVHVPPVEVPLRAPQLGKRRMVLRVARGVAMVPPFQVRLEDAVDDVAMVERVHDVLEHAPARL